MSADDFLTRYRDRFTFAPDGPDLEELERLNPDAGGPGWPPTVAGPNLCPVEPPEPLPWAEPQEAQEAAQEAQGGPEDDGPPPFDPSAGPEPVVSRSRGPRPRRPGDLGEATWAERFRDFDAAHPEVWEALVRFADEALDAGARRFGVRAILERVRWERLVTRDAGEAYAINNNYAGFYARKLADLGPRYADALELREGRHVGH